MRSAICLIVRDEVRDIAEWIAFHALAGFDTQIILDHGSTDGTAEIIARAAEFHDIRLHSWTDNGANSQITAYHAVCRSYRQQFDWIAFIDSDEFLVLPSCTPMNEFLGRFHGWSGVALHWAVYGSSGHVDMPAGLVVENFIRRAREEFRPARHVKSIVRPSAVLACLNPHCFELAPGERGTYCDAEGHAIAWLAAPEHQGVLRGFSATPPQYDTARVNHYFTRSRAHWQAKLARGYPNNVAVRTEADFDEHDRNDIEDEAALGRLPALRAAVARIGRG